MYSLDHCDDTELGKRLRFRGWRRGHTWHIGGTVPGSVEDFPECIPRRFVVARLPSFCDVGVRSAICSRSVKAPWPLSRLRLRLPLWLACAWPLGLGRPCACRFGSTTPRRKGAGSIRVQGVVSLGWKGAGYDSKPRSVTWAAPLATSSWAGGLEASGLV